MNNWLRPLLLMFHAPTRGMGEVRDRAPLGSAVLLCLLAQTAYQISTRWLTLGRNPIPHGILVGLLVAYQVILPVLFISIVLTPAMAFVSNLFDRKASFRVVIQQEYAPLASVLLYVWAASCLATIVLALFMQASGFLNQYVQSSLITAEQIIQRFPMIPADLRAQLLDPIAVAASLFRSIKVLWFAVGMIIAVRTVFRISSLRSIGVTVASVTLVFVTSPLWSILFNWVLASPFMVLLLFVLLRGYVGDIFSSSVARAQFKRNLEAATVNPADASAHYNLGLIHFNRKELNEAKGRFELAIGIDADEIDSHYQLGRIARLQKRFADAIAHFEQVVTRDQSHSQHEIWREIGATYLDAGQFEDALDALEKFLANREGDAEGLYLRGRAHGALGHRREAEASMQACIEAVKTAPAYKYRTEKRWLNEAQQFLRTVDSRR
jgi:tetratricopeptide (TPR) repeat protein